MAANLNLMAPQKAWETKYADDGGSVISTNADQTLNALLNWGRANSIWYMLFGLACCAIELMQTGGPRSDLERFGAAPRPSPRSSDLFIILRAAPLWQGVSRSGLHLRKSKSRRLYPHSSASRQHLESVLYRHD